MRALTRLTLAAFTCATGCEPYAGASSDTPSEETASLPDMEAELPEAPTAVRIAMFGATTDAASLRAWPAWVQVDEAGLSGFLLVGTQFKFVDRSFRDVGYPAADVEFGAPPPEATIGCGDRELSPNGDPCVPVEVPVVLVTSADDDLTAIATLGALDDEAAFGISSSLAFRDDALQIETVDEETGEPSTFLGIPLTTVGEYRRYDDESLEGQTMRTPLR